MYKIQWAIEKDKAQGLQKKLGYNKMTVIGNQVPITLTQFNIY